MPGMPDSWRLTIQSCMVRSSMASYLSSYPGATSSVYWYISPRPVVMGIISGMPSSVGISPATVWICSLMSCRASSIGTLSLNTTVTTESPKRDTERISSTFMMLLMATSMGNVMSCSTSCGASVGETVTICTWLLVISGTASTGSVSIAYIPPASRKSVVSPTNNFFVTAKRTIA